MPGTKHLANRRRDRCRVGCHGRDRNVVDVLDALELLLDRGIRRKDGVVLVLAERPLPLAGHHADHLEGLIPDAHDLPCWIHVGAEQRIGHHTAEYCDLRRRVDVLLGEEHPVPHGPHADVREIDVRPFDTGGPVLVSGDDLSARVDTRCHVLHAGDVTQGGGVVGRQRGGHSLTLADASRLEVARIHVDQVRPRRLDLIFDRRLRSAAERHHRDDGTDADDHAEHRQDRAHLVAIERLQRDAERHQNGHRNSPSSRRRGGRPARRRPVRWEGRARAAAGLPALWLRRGGS